MASRLLDKVQQEEQESTTVPKLKPKKSAVGQIASSDSSKDQQISAKVNSGVYAEFTAINKAQGLSNNSALNMIINRYVRENRGILEL